MTALQKTSAVLAALAVATAFGINSVHTQEPVPRPPEPGPGAGPAGPEVQARGPVHEGYAGPSAAVPQVTGVVPKAPPAAIEELPADQKPEGDVQWIPGYWHYDADLKDYLWVSGFWRTPPPGRVWVPGHWNEASGGWQWVPGFWQAPEQTEVSYLPAPPAPVQAAPSVPAPNPEAVYVPGNWVWRGIRFVWRPGYWVTYRPGWLWVPAHYVWSPAGYVFIEGYWDYPLRERGLLFAPVVIDVRFYRQPRYVYQPTFVVADDCLYGSLFIQPSCSHYYYGDYFAVGYRNSGYVAWCDVRYGGFGCDPLFSYYRWNYRNDPTWTVELRAVYTGRYNGTIAPPPRTIVNNVTIINQNTTIVNTTVKNRFVSATPMVQPLNKVKTMPGMKLQPVTSAQQVTHQQAAKQIQVLSTQRRQQEKQIQAARPAGAAAPTVPQTVKLNLPKTVASAAPAPTGAKAPPPSPITPHMTPPTGPTPAHNPTAPGQPKTMPTIPPTPGHPVAPTTPMHPGAPTAPNPIRPLPTTPMPAHPTTPMPLKPAPLAPAPGTSPMPGVAPRPGTAPGLPPRPGTQPPSRVPPRPAPHPSDSDKNHK